MVPCRARVHARACTRALAHTQVTMRDHVTHARLRRATRDLMRLEKSRADAASAAAHAVAGAAALSVGKRWALAHRAAHRARARMARAVHRSADSDPALRALREPLAVLGDALAAADASLAELSALNARLREHMQAWHAGETRRAAAAATALAHLRQCEAAAAAAVSASTAFSPLASVNGVAEHVPTEPACWLTEPRLHAPLSDLLNYEHPPAAAGAAQRRVRPARRALRAEGADA